MNNGYFNDQSGSALILLLLLSAVIATAGLYMSAQIVADVKYSKRPILHQILKIVHDEAYFYLTNEQSWQHTATKPDNPSLNCVGTLAGCPDQATDMVFYNIEDDLVLGSATLGFTNKGEVCNTYDEVGAGDSDCPMRYKLTWQPVCPPTPPCTTSTIEVKAVIEINDPGINDAKNLNLGKYDIVIYRQYPP